MTGIKTHTKKINIGGNIFLKRINYNKLINKNEFKREKGFFFFCNNCNDGVEVIAEYWTKDSDGPHRIELIQHNLNQIAITLEQINLQTNLINGKETIYHYCGRCSNLIDQGCDVEELNVIIYFDMFQTMNQKN